MTWRDMRIWVTLGAIAVAWFVVLIGTAILESDD